MGVLVTKVNYYEEYLQYFIQKITNFSKKYVVFNVIAEIDNTSSNYPESDHVGHSTVLSSEKIALLLDKFVDFSYSMKKYQLFPDAVDLFITMKRIS